MKPNKAEAAAHCQGWFGWAHVYDDGFSVFTVFAMQRELGWGTVRNQALQSSFESVTFLSQECACVVELSLSLCLYQNQGRI